MGVKGGGGRGCPGVSVELEKGSKKRALLAPLADVVRGTYGCIYNRSALVCAHVCVCVCMQLLLSKEYAQYRGYHTMEQAAVDFRASARTE